jgi:hypothetical protein
MRVFRVFAFIVAGVVLVVGGARAADPSWPKEITFALRTGYS